MPRAIEREMSHPARAAIQLGVPIRAADPFLAALSHELRTPLTPILLALQSLARRDDLPAAARDALEMIRRNVTIESRLIDNLLDFAHIASGKFDIDSQPMDLHVAARAAIDACAADIGARVQTLTIALDAPRCRARGDSNRLRQVVFNLLSNASKFTRAGGAIRVASANSGEWFVLSVADDGIGIDPDALAHVFEQFRHEHERMKRDYGGLGLGLAICKATVEAHGGTVRAESAGAGRGATFAVQLPLI